MYTRRFFGGMAIIGTLNACSKHEPVMSTEELEVLKSLEDAQEYAARNLPIDRRQQFMETARYVSKNYTTAIVRLQYKTHVFEIPANFYSPSWRELHKADLIPGADKYDIKVPFEAMGGWKFFWPTMEGFTRTNWYNSADKRIIDYKTFAIHPAGSTRPTTKVAFENLSISGAIETQASETLYGLKGYKIKNSEELIWIGERANGAMFKMTSPHPEDHAALARDPFPRCDVRMFDAQDGEEVAYRFATEQFAHWKTIDFETQRLIKSWRKN